MKVTEMVAGILSVTSAEELKILQGAINTQMRALQTHAKKQFAIGDVVSFTAKGGTHSGTVTKLNPKTVVVATRVGTWRVSPTLLTKSNGLDKE